MSTYVKALERVACDAGEVRGAVRAMVNAMTATEHDRALTAMLEVAHRLHEALAALDAVRADSPPAWQIVSEDRPGIGGVWVVLRHGVAVAVCGLIDDAAAHVRRLRLNADQQPRAAIAPSSPPVKSPRRLSWQCSGCHVGFYGPWLKVCPSCRREDYWTGSVYPDAKEWDGRPASGKEPVGCGCGHPAEAHIDVGCEELVETAAGRDVCPCSWGGGR